MAGFLSGLVQKSDIPNIGSAKTPVGQSDLTASVYNPNAGGGTQQGPANPDDSLSQLANMRLQLQSQDPNTVINALAGSLAGSGVGTGSGAGSSASATPYTAAAPASANPTGSLGSWIQQAEQLAGVSGPQWTNGLDIIAQHESGGNPKAVNNWDSNAKAGHPSEGLMQTIGPTFNSYALPGYTDIWNPVDNMVAAIRYIQSRYGGINNVPGVERVDSGQSYVGY